MRWQRRNTQTSTNAALPANRDRACGKPSLPSEASGVHRELIATSDVRVSTSAVLFCPTAMRGVMQAGRYPGAGAAGCSGQRHRVSARPANAHIASASTSESCRVTIVFVEVLLLVLGSQWALCDTVGTSSLVHD